MSRRSQITDVERFMRSHPGRQFLDGIRRHLHGRTILDVTFTGSADGIATTLRLENGDIYGFMDEELTLDTLRDQFNPLFNQLRAHTRKGASNGTNESRPERGS